MNFNQKCYNLLKKIPRGKVVTYKQIAEKLGCRGYRAVGNAMNKNPYAPKVPCHRVVCFDGSLGGYLKGVDEKIKLLRKEGVEIRNNKIDLGRFGWEF